MLIVDLNSKVRLAISHVDQGRMVGAIVEEDGVEFKMVTRDSRLTDFEITIKSQDSVKE